MNRADIAVAFDNTGLRENIVYLLRQNSYNVNDLNLQGTALIRSLLASPPDMLICDHDFFGAKNMNTLKIIIEDGICFVVIFLNDAEREVVTSLLEGREGLYIMQKPINEAVFLNNIEFILRNIDRITDLEREVTDLRDVLETRKLLDKAKAVLMRDLDISEEAAHRMIQKKSMETRKPVRELAKKILKYGGLSGS